MFTRKMQLNKWKIGNSWKTYIIHITGEDSFTVEGFSDYLFYFSNNVVQCTNKTRMIKKTINGKICLYSDITEGRTSINMHSFTSLVSACFKGNEIKQTKGRAKRREK